MSQQDDERAVTVLIGALLLALVFVLLTATLQTTAVPEWNQGVEIDHSEQVQEDLAQLRDAIVDTSADDNPRSVSVALGTNYPRRWILQNPSDPIGTLETQPESVVEIENATATGDESVVWNGTTRSFTTRALVYEPHYNRYHNAPTTTYEHWLVVNEFAGADQALTDHQLITGNRIGVLLLDGTVQATRNRPITVDVTPVSAPAQAVVVTDTSDPIVLEVPTTMTNETWSDLLADEYVSNGGHIADQSYRSGSPYNVLVLTLERGVSYELHISKVVVGDSIPQVDPHYLLSRGEDTRVTDEDERTKLVFEARDRYDNPISNAPVALSASAGQFENEAGDAVQFPVKTNSDGVASVWYDADGNIGIHKVSAYLNESADSSLPDRKRLDVEVINTGGAGMEATGLVEPTGSVSITDEDVDITFNNRAGTSINLTGIRLVDVSVVVYGSGALLGSGEHSQAVDAADQISTVALGSDSKSMTAAEGEGPVFLDDPIELSTGLNELTLTFDSTVDPDDNDALDLRFVLYYDHGLRSEYAVNVNLL